MTTDFVKQTDPPEICQFIESLRKFSTESLRADAKHSVSFNRKHFKQMAAIGLTGMALDEQHGGSNISRLGIASCIFELARVQLGPAVYLSVHLMVSQLIRQWTEQNSPVDLLKELAAGTKLAAFCLTEAGAGSDAAALVTRAESDGQEFVINGEKIYITSGSVADIYLVFARTSSDKTKGISAFIVHKDSPGISCGKPEQKMGCEGAPITTVTFENCRVSSSALLGKAGDGYRIALSGLAGGRVNMAACACGLASRSIELAATHLNERKQFGKALAEFQGLQFMLADMATQTRAAVLMTRDAAEALDSGSNERLSTSMAKCFATDAAMQVTTDGVQLFGGAGYLADYEVERLMRDSKMLQIVEGTNQIQRVIIAREVLAAFSHGSKR